MRRCLTCNGLIPRGQRCARCGTRKARGYGHDWDLVSRAQIARMPWCLDCGHTGSSDNPLTADHIVPKDAGGDDRPENLTTRCRRCNSSKGSSSEG